MNYWSENPKCSFCENAEWAWTGTGQFGSSCCVEFCAPVGVQKNMLEDRGPYAVFCLARAGGDWFAACTRPDAPGKIGLPGGKLEDGEAPIEALLRESKEEGWVLYGVQPRPFYAALIEGRLIHWYKGGLARRLPEYKEQDRLKPVHATMDEIRASGFGNEAL